MKEEASSGPAEIERRVGEMLPNTHYRWMRSDQEREDVFRLRYQAYLREGAIIPDILGSLQDRFDDMTNAFNIGLTVEGRLVGAVRICVWSRQFFYETTPGVEVFREELTPFLTEDAVLIDPNRFVIDTSFTRSERAITFLVMRVVFMACLKFHATVAIATARREHCGFYRRSFGHKQFTEPRHYPGLTKPLALLINDFPASRQPTIDRYPSWAPLGDDLERIFDEAVAAKQPPASAIR